MSTEPNSKLILNVPIRVILLRSLYETNVGSVSRVMSNMGANSLILIDRKCSITFKAQQAAATGQTALSTRTELNSLQEYLEKSPSSLKIALTCRGGKARQIQSFSQSLKSIPELLEGRYPMSERPSSVDLIFGPEDAGLSAEEVDACHLACSLETFGTNTSLNLSHAVLLTLYLFQSQFSYQANPQIEEESIQESVPFPAEILKKWLWETGFDVVDRPVNAYTILKRWLLRGLPSSRENKILETVLHQGIRKMQEYNSERRKKGLPAGYSHNLKSSDHKGHSEQINS